MVSGRLTLLAAGFAVFSAAVAFQGQDPNAKAEQRFKNIQSFRGQPAREIVPAMQFISASLGVDCDFCHVQSGFEKDDKPEKNAARKMIAMMRDINNRNFGGANTVTCVTCHQGHAMPTNVPAIKGAVQTFTATSGARAMDILGKYRSAIGGDAAISNLKSIHLTGMTTVGDSKPNAVELYQVSPNRYLVVDHLPNGERRQAYNGQTTWSAMGARVRPLVDSNALRAQRIGRFFRDPSSMPSYSEISTGTGAIDGKTMNVVKGVRGADRVSEMLYFDPATGLLNRVEYMTSTILGDMPEVYDYSDYRPVNGVMVPFKVTQHTTEGSVVRQFDRADANPAIDSTMFEVPKTK
jgi:hypothetical protein